MKQNQKIERDLQGDSEISGIRYGYHLRMITMFKKRDSNIENFSKGMQTIKEN